MPRGTLTIGTKRYSSWSMRGWLAVHLAGLDVEERVLPIGLAPIGDATPSGLVPYLEYDGARIWETLAICEFCAEAAPSLWPADRTARAAARSIAAEMHAGFRALRIAYPMNLGRTRKPPHTEADVLADIARIETIWAGARKTTAFLYSDTFGAADAMFAPVVARFLSYLPELSSESRAYCHAVRTHPLVARWYDEAAAEPGEWLLPRYEDVP